MSQQPQDDRTPPEAPQDTASKKRTHPDDFKRAYKACINCRQRKAKCILDTTPEGELKPPCQRCKREMRECVFRSERSWVKRRKPGEAREFEDHPTEHHDNIPSGTSGAQMSNQHRASISAQAISPHDSVHTRRSDIMSPPAHLRRVSTSQPDLSHSVMRTVVSSGSDALNLLFEAAHHRDALENQARVESQAQDTPRSAGPDGQPSSPFTFKAQPVQMSQPSQETLRVWTTCRFVQMGWFSAHEAVTYVDLFFKNCSPLSPILSDFYSHHENHWSLIALDPFLCVTILMISSRYNILPGVGGASRGYFVHDRLWEQCQRFIMKIMLGQVKLSKAQSRTIGSIEALLLLSEWHPRALHFPTASDGWDCELMIGANNTTSEGVQILEGDTTSSRWLEDVIEPAKRSDRMSWMLMGCALSLAQELGLFEENGNVERDQQSYPKTSSEALVQRRIRARKLLYVFIEQLSWRLGCTSMIPQSLNHALMEKLPVNSTTGAPEEWQGFMSAWVELTKLARSVSDTIYPSTNTTRNLLRTGRYIGLLEHFQPLLTTWRKKYLDPCKLKVGLHDMLCIEYQYVRIYTNSLGMQAVVERTLAETDPDGPPEEILPLNLEPRDYDFIQEVVDGSCQILQKVVQLYESGALRYSPVRIFLRITASSIYLIKALSLGSRNQKLQNSLDILDAAIRAMRSSTLDDMHLASRYATLLDLHVAKLRENFVVSARPPRIPSRGVSLENNTTAGMDFLNNHNAGTSGIASLANDVHGLMPDDDWLALPFDPAMAPFGLDSNPSFQQGFDDGTLDFIWNLPM
ncbi:C6 transcription factor-like protein [Karstenula rhodostoma CBS 690.94]|uniref:C6 transcription factor-like protein n=1 Tax=Karstenula rhodostoma CBS 690.94 TaxID=1392251 RepID=A0A9P4PIS3_9PLEO|nr:C6 transcription factor-like protein [Karstenula rhodostoma CBS 690.94]